MATGRCIFCGTVDVMTDAHVFRKGWIEEIFPDVVVFVHQRQAHMAGHEGQTSWRLPWSDLKASGAVCGACNGGWMNDLDHAAEAIVATRAALGIDVRLGLMVERRTVARWCVLVSALLDRMSATPRLAASTFNAIYQGDVPDSAEIWMSKRDTPAEHEERVFTSAKDLEIRPEGGSAFFITFGVRDLVVQVYLPTEDTPADLALRRLVHGSIAKQLWPDSLMPFVWPPATSLTTAAVETLRDSFQRVEPVPASNDLWVP